MGRGGSPSPEEMGSPRGSPGIPGRFLHWPGMTLVAKLGSSIVANDDGSLRSDVLDGVCAQVAELHHGGENVVLVTSGAIARGMRVLGLDRRPNRLS